MFIKPAFWPPHEISILFTLWDGQLLFSQTSCQEKDKRPKCAEMNATGREASGSFRCEIRLLPQMEISRYLELSIAIAAYTCCTNGYEDCQWPLHELYPYFVGYEKAIALDTTSIATPFLPVSPWLGPELSIWSKAAWSWTCFTQQKQQLWLRCSHSTIVFTLASLLHLPLSELISSCRIGIRFQSTIWLCSFQRRRNAMTEPRWKAKQISQLVFPDLFYLYHIWSNLHQSIYSFSLRYWSLSSFPLLYQIWQVKPCHKHPQLGFTKLGIALFGKT